jgi:hypothetical protein
MTRQAGIPVIALFETTDQINQALPAQLADFFNRFIAIELDSRTSDGAIIQTGRLQSLDSALTGTGIGEDVDEFDLGFAKLRFPGLTTGVPFQFAKRRVAVVDTLEPGADSWQFDLFLTDFTLIFDGLVGARPIQENGTTPRHLEPLPGRPPVAFTGSAALRIEQQGADSQVITRLINVVAGSDPFLPDALSGGVAQITCSPPHFICGKSGFGFTIRDALYDGSTRSSPPFVIERGQSAAWTGFALREATIYTPPAALGTCGFSATLRDFLIGNPAGLQGELEFQFGRSPLSPSTFVFKQDNNNINSSFDFNNGTLEITALPGETVTLDVSLTVPAPPANDPDGITDYEAEFRFPHQTAIKGDSATGQVRHGDILEITPIEVIGIDPDARRLKKPPFTVRMVASGKACSLSLAVAGTELDNVVDLTGPMEKMDGLVLTATPNPADASATFHWQCEALGIDQEGLTLGLSLPSSARGVHHIVVTQKDAADKGATRLRLRLREPDSGGLFIGCQNGVFSANQPTVAMSIAAVLGTYDLTRFHESGVLAGAGGQATHSGATVTVPDGMIAEVAIDEGGAPAETVEDRHVQVLFNFDDQVPVSWGKKPPQKAKQPFGDSGTQIHEALLGWAANYPGAQFQVIGRCDDVGTDTYNIELANRRATAVLNLLTTQAGGQTELDAASVRAVGEQTISTLWPGAAALIEPDVAESPGRLINQLGVSASWPKNSQNNGIRTDPPDATREEVREQYRRADIYAVGGTAQGSSSKSTSEAISPSRRRVLVPAEDRATAPADNDNANADYRVKILLGWDRPRFSGVSDLIPNLAELEYAWTPSDDGISLTQEVLTLYGKWIYDDLTGFTEFAVGIKSEGDPDGLLKTEQANLVAALAFGPMLASGVDFDEDAFGSAARLAALATLASFASADMGGGKKLIGAGSKSALIGLESKTTTRTLEDPLASFKTQLAVDYTNELNINTGALGLQTREPMKLRYDKVGVEFDNTDPDADLLNKLGFVYASDSMTIEDSGLWEIAGPLQDLLRVTEFRMGVGSFWVEPTLAVALDLGVVEISEASFRVTFKTNASGAVTFPPEFSLRGLSAKVDIPAALKGEGQLKIEDGGIIKAGLDVTVIPLQIRAVAALAVGKPANIAPSVYLNIYARVQFPGGIPLGPLPLAIHGFIGQTVINGERDVADTTDIVTREIGWWGKQPVAKYEAVRGQHALGVGVVIGTLPDASFSLSAMGMVVVAFPDPEVILGVEVNLLSVPDTTAKDEKDSSSASITGLVIIDNEAVSIAVSAQYDIPEILKLKVPFSAYFPYPGSGKHAYVRLGADNVHGRAGEPITITLLPSTINLKAWSYLMIEGGGITSLGGETGWDFDGFAIGFGAGVGIEWKAGPIGLSASARILVGFGTDPLIIKGGLFINGKLDLVVVSISARGDIVLTYIDRPNAAAELSLDGEFCGEVDMFFFSLKGCVDFFFGSEHTITPAPPPPPVKSVSLTNPVGATMGEATTGSPQGEALFDFIEVNGVSQNQGVPPKDNHTVWPNTVPLLNFSHFIKDALPAEGQFDTSAQPAGDLWFGSSRLKYAYRLDDVTLRKASGGDVSDPSGEPLQAAWTHSPSRAADDTSGANGTPSGAEATHLQLLNWDPWAWPRSTENGGEGQPGDPGLIIERICDPLPEPRRACLYGDSAGIISLTEARLRRNAPSQGPYPSKFTAIGQAFYVRNNQALTRQSLTSLLATQGLNMRAGETVNVPNVVIGGRSLSQGYRLPAAQDITPTGAHPLALPWRANLDRDVTDGELTLLVCQNSSAAGENGQCYMFEDAVIGAQSVHFDLKPYVFTAMDPQKPLEISDRVDISRPADPRAGSDGKADLIINYPGTKLELKTPCRELVLYYYRTGSGAIIFTLHHLDGSTTQVSADAPPSVPMLTTLRSDSGLRAVEIALKAKSINMYRMCCLKPRDGSGHSDRVCLNLEALPHSVDGSSNFSLDGAQFATLSPDDIFRRANGVDATTEPAKRGTDGATELIVPFKGMTLDLPASCRHLEVSVLLGAGPVTVKGLNVEGKLVAEATTLQVQSIGITLTLTSADPITRLEITGGSGEALLYRVCCLRSVSPEKPRVRCIDFGALSEDINGLKSAVVQGVTIQPLNREPIKLVDVVDTQPAPTAGSDNGAELYINLNGVALTLPRDCSDLELHVMHFSGQPVSAEGYDNNRKLVAQGQSGQQQKTPHVIRLRAQRPITSVVVRGGGGEGVIYRICCLSGPAGIATNRCITFKNARRRSLAVESLEQEGLVFTDLANQKTLRITDRITIDGTEFRAGSDGVNELGFGANGLGITLPHPCSNVRLLLALPKGAKYKIQALTRDGRSVKGEGGRSIGNALSITLKGQAISRIVIDTTTSGMLAEICVCEADAETRDTGNATHRNGREPRREEIALPVVTAEDVDGDGQPSTWPGELIQTFTQNNGVVCGVVRYQMPRGADAFDRVIVTPRNKSQELTLLGLCGVDERAALWRARDEEVRDDLINAITKTAGSGGTPNAAGSDGRPVLLDPNSEYELEVKWSWQSWVGEDDNDNAPATPPAGKFSAGTPQVFRFRTAPEDASLPKLQDGPNEYVFDPRDVDRYLVGSDPKNGEIAHFTDDPVVFHFSQDHIANLLERYGRELNIEIRRTDPPAQANADIAGLIAPLPGILEFFMPPLEMLSDFERRINAVVAEKPCIPGINRVLGGTTLAGIFPLEPRVMYDADLMTRMITNAGEKIRVQASRFMTSRYANPTEMIEALGMDTAGSVAPVPMKELILDAGASVPSDVLSASDRDFDAAMVAMGLDTLGLPDDEPRMFQIWQPNATGTVLSMVGVLVDALEPLDRIASVIVDSEVQIAIRCRIDHARIDGYRFKVIRRTRNATRALLRAPSGFIAPADASSFELHFETNNAMLIGRQYVRTLPLVMQIEGF